MTTVIMLIVINLTHLGGPVVHEQLYFQDYRSCDLARDQVYAMYDKQGLLLETEIECLFEKAPQQPILRTPQ